MHIVGTYTLLEVVRNYWNNLDSVRKAVFRFHHILTNEVFGDLADNIGSYSERTNLEIVNLIC